MKYKTVNSQEFTIQKESNFFDKLLDFTSGYETFCVLTSNDFYKGKDLSEKPYYHDFDAVAAIGAKDILKHSEENSKDFFKDLVLFHSQINDHLFGYFGYDLKNEIEKLQSNHPDLINLPNGYFFQPEIIVWIKGNTISIQSNTEESPEDIFNRVLLRSNTVSTLNLSKCADVKLSSRFTKSEYLDTVETLRNHIIEGDVYEISFCQEFYAENVEIDPLKLFQKLIKISPNPFASFMKIEGRYVLSSSMERFLKKEGNKLISQPIKGTIRKSANQEEDLKLQQQLLNDEKERAENVMIVDLVRNDLAKSSHFGTVKVEELFGIYPFSQVHQMISTVSSELRKNVPWADAIKNAFPMGSMTGAPKVMAMKLIEQYERSKRGIFSGSIGYISPKGDFDLNVVIRTFIYNSLNQYLSLHVGSAITYDSIPENEYEECMIKIEGLRKALEGN